MRLSIHLILLSCWCLSSNAFLPSLSAPRWTTQLHASEPEDPEVLRKRAQDLRKQIRDMEEKLGDNRKRAYEPPVETAVEDAIQGMSLRGKQVLVAGANGRLGSLVCRYLLRNHPEVKVVASVHYVGENSPTARGYARLSYEVGAEDGIGSIGSAWNMDDRTATFEFAPEMKDYNLQNLRIVECEYLDPVQCMSVTEGCDAVIWCATDFNGNTPRAVAGFNAALLFRAVTRPTKGRVEVEGLQNMLGALKVAKQDKQRVDPSATASDPINFVLVSMPTHAFLDFETPFGTFHDLKRQGERMLADFPSLTSTALRLNRFDDNFVEEGLDIQFEVPAVEDENNYNRRITRRDAARAVVDALLREDWKGETVEVWTDTK